jgi:hypothetical protein
LVVEEGTPSKNKHFCSLVDLKELEYKSKRETPKEVGIRFLKPKVVVFTLLCRSKFNQYI